ncbi:hypothetical protein LZ012_04970 [Dechloromonas sp. XY25]|uniref:Phasin family protein n=1 Tax=Dechloromonas hankyongensis TaxID=2908002 RepID=A0ABS9JZK6_9RHOO|nr:polyhydroxyalkanoate granule-associated phasin [Dechloromonas hankyongensis]MCG2576343.1 hypothetical protein [Dechloromonas hankyongensis]
MAVRRTTKSLATKSVELAIAAPQVVAHRVARMAAAGAMPSVRDRREFERMGAEKVAAFSESMTAMAQQAFRANQTLAASMFRTFWSPWTANSAARLGRDVHEAVLDVLDKGMAPVHGRATANAKRLARSKRR